MKAKVRELYNWIHWACCGNIEDMLAMAKEERSIPSSDQPYYGAVIAHIEGMIEERDKVYAI